MMRTSYLSKESYEMHEEKSWKYNNYPSYSYDHQHVHPISSLDDRLYLDNRRTHHDDGTLCWCGTIHVNKTTTLLKKKDVHQGVLGLKPILRPPLGYQPNHYKTTTYYGSGGAYEYDKFIGDMPYQHQCHDGRTFEHDRFMDRSHQQRQLGGGGAAYEYDRFIDRSNQHSSDKGHVEGCAIWKANLLDGGDLVEKTNELESLIKDMELNGRGRGVGVKVIELVQVERTRTYGHGFRKQWNTSSTYRPSNGHIFSIDY